MPGAKNQASDFRSKFTLLNAKDPGQSLLSDVSPFDRQASRPTMFSDAETARFTVLLLEYGAV